MEDSGQRTGQTGVVHGKQQPPIWSVENTGRVPEENDERKIQVSQLRFVKNITSLKDFGRRNYDIIYLISLTRL